MRTHGLILMLAMAGCGHPNPQLEGRSARQWIAELDSKTPSEQQQAIAVLVRGGEEVAGLLRDVLRREDADAVAGAARALIQIGGDGRRAVLAALKSSHFETRLELARALLATNIEAELALDAVWGGLGHEDPMIRHQAIHVLSDLSPDTTAVVPPLMAALTSHAPEIRWRAATALVRIGPAAAEAVPPLRAALGDADPRVRLAAVQALAAIGQPAQVTQDELSKLVDDPDEEVRWHASELVRQWQASADAGIMNAAPD